VIRILRIAALTAALVGTLVATGATGLVGAQQQDVPEQGAAAIDDLDCGSDRIVLVQNDGQYVPTRGRPAQGPQSDRAALARFLRQERVPLSSTGFERKARRGGHTQFVHRKGGGIDATVSVRAIGATYYVPSFAACDPVASRAGGRR
jgi:hypothetical protein